MILVARYGMPVTFCWEEAVLRILRSGIRMDLYNGMQIQLYHTP